METIASTLGSLGATAFRWSVIAFILINGIAVVGLLVTRDRSLVNRWTAKLLAADLLLLGTGIGIPVVTGAARMVIEAVAGVTPPGPTGQVERRVEVRRNDR
jgi:hypothetical protein